MRTVLRLLAALGAAFILGASGCEQTEINDEGLIVVSETGERIDADEPSVDVEPADDGAGVDEGPEDASAADEPPIVDPQDEDDAGTPDEPPPTGPVELALSDPVGDDAPLDTVVLAEFDADGYLVTTLDGELRDASWAGAVLYLSFQGTDFELQCGVSTGSGVCNNFGLPNFDCAGSSAFDDAGTGPIVIEWPVRQDATGMVIDLSPTDGCLAPSNATVTGGFVFQISSDGVGESAAFADGFESGDTSAWAASTP